MEFIFYHGSERERETETEKKKSGNNEGGLKDNDNRTDTKNCYFLGSSHWIIKITFSSTPSSPTEALNFFYTASHRSF